MENFKICTIQNKVNHFNPFIIQLLLGERKAIFEDCESEKTENKDRIKKLKDEVRDLQAEVQASNKSSEGILRHVQVQDVN